MPNNTLCLYPMLGVDLTSDFDSARRLGEGWTYILAFGPPCRHSDRRNHVVGEIAYNTILPRPLGVPRQQEQSAADGQAPSDRPRHDAGRRRHALCQQEQTFDVTLIRRSASTSIHSAF